MSEDWPPEIYSTEALRTEFEGKSREELIELAIYWATEAKLQSQTGKYWHERAMELSRR